MSKDPREALDMAAVILAILLGGALFVSSVVAAGVRGEAGVSKELENKQFVVGQRVRLSEEGKRRGFGRATTGRYSRPAFSGGVVTLLRGADLVCVRPDGRKLGYEWSKNFWDPVMG